MELLRANGNANSGDIRKLSANGMTVYRGWNGRLIDELIEKSRQPHILDKVYGTPGDHGRRFMNVETAARYLSMGHKVVYSMHATDPDELAGVIWYDERPRPDLDASHTFAIRLYERAKGRGLAQPFMHIAHRDFTQSLQTIPTVWLERNKDNEVTKHLYEKFGYVAVQESDFRTTMVLRPVDRVARFYD